MEGKKEMERKKSREEGGVRGNKEGDKEKRV